MRIGSGKEASRRILQAEVIGGRATCQFDMFMFVFVHIASTCRRQHAFLVCVNRGTNYKHVRPATHCADTRTLSCVKINISLFSHIYIYISLKGGSLKSKEAGTCQSKASGDHVAANGSLSGVPSKWSARGWSVVQLGHDEDMEPRLGMYGTLGAAFAVQRTIKRAELTGFLCVCAEEQLVPPQLVWMTKESSMVFGEEKCNALVRKRKMPICGFRSGRRCAEFIQKEHFKRSNMSKRIAERRKHTT